MKFILSQSGEICWARSYHQIPRYENPGNPQRSLSEEIQDKQNEN